MSPRIKLGLIIGLLLLTSLACQTGEVLTVEEATKRATEARAVVVGTKPADSGSSATEQAAAGSLQPGDQATLVSRSFMVNLYGEPGSVRLIAQQERGTVVEVNEVAQVDEDLWYLIKAPTGLGWVFGENLEAIAAEPEDVDAGLQPGDTGYLVGRSFMISFYQEAGGNRIIAQQERGAAVEIQQAAEVDGVTWYLVNAPTGQGWIAAENITSEAP